MINLEFALTGKSSLSQLWRDVAAISQHAVDDNEATRQLNSPYPLGIRQLQIISLKALIAEIENNQNTQEGK